MEIKADGNDGSLILLKQGAEARVFESTFVGRRSIVNKCFSKKYRHPSLDSKLILKCLNAEARCMTRGRRLGVCPPTPYVVDAALHTLTFEYVEGIRSVLAIKARYPRGSKRVFESTFVGRRSIVKEGFSKKYKHPSLDSKLILKCLKTRSVLTIKAGHPRGSKVVGLNLFCRCSLAEFPVWLCGQKSTSTIWSRLWKLSKSRRPTTDRKRRLGTTSLVGMVNTPILTWRRKTVMKDLGIRISWEKDVGQEGDAPKKAGRDEYYNESDLQVWKDRCLRIDNKMKGMANKLVDLQSVVNFMM
ncbi:hypothetical protein ACSBR2_021112 [Camellia fascicularis]